MVNFGILLLDSSKFTCWTPFWILFSFTSMFLTDISSLTIYRNFEMFSCLSNFLFLFQECSVVNTLGTIACLGLFPPGGMVSTTRRRFGKTMVEVVHPGEFRFI